MRLKSFWLTGTCCVFLAPAAWAGGYDTPMLYSARHMGMGGTAIGAVNDPSALFHNPAGLGHVQHLAVLGDFSLLVGGIQGSPGVTARSIDSETTVAPFFLVGGGVRLTDFLAVGVGIYPIASSGATYRYGNNIENTTTLLFVEASPAIAVNLPGNVRLGAGYRVTYVQLERFQGDAARDTQPFLDLSLDGFNFLGLRLGAQWTPIPELQLGLVYRHVTETEVSADDAIAIFEEARDVSTSFTLPSRVGLGARLELQRWLTVPLAVAVDLEYALNSQNEGDPLEGTRTSTGERLSVPNVFEWQNALTARFGLEYAITSPVADRPGVAVRAGYVFDEKTANEQYPTAFGTPPAPTHIFTTGLGLAFERFQANIAYAYRFGSTEITEDDVSGPERRACTFCGAAGDYAIALNGFYVDVSYQY